MDNIVCQECKKGLPGGALYLELHKGQGAGPVCFSCWKRAAEEFVAANPRYRALYESKFDRPPEDVKA